LPLTLDSLPAAFYITFGTIFGLLWGSFLNVVIYRVPLGMSVVSPPSHCPQCKAKVKAWQNVPVLSYVFLGGKTGCCKTKLSLRYPLVELIGGVLAVAILEVLVLPLPGDTSLGRAGAIFVAYLALSLALVAAAFIDLEHMILPLSISIGGAVLGVATSGLRDMTFTESLIGAAVGFVIVWLPFDFLYRKIRGKVGMGMGDAFLVMLAGAWFGWQGVLITLFGGAIQGTVAAIFTMIFRGKIEEPEAVQREREEIRAEIEALPENEREEAMREWRDADPMADEQEEGALAARMPFGPSLCLAILEQVLFGKFLRDVLGLLGGE
jgi:leader peptidase (prepilin peptidase)/N-methyltransferase